MNCEKYSEWISLYIDEELTEEDHAVLEDHIENCESCREEVQVLRKITKDLENIQMINLPEGFHEDLMGKIKLESKADQGKVISLPLKQRKWYVNFKIVSGLAAVFIFSTILIKPTLFQKSLESVPEMTMMDESQEVENNMSKVRMMPDLRDDVLEDGPADPPQMQVEEPTQEVAEAAMPTNEEASSGRAILRGVDPLPIQTCTVMTAGPQENTDYIIDLAKSLGLEAAITETRGSEELQNQIITLEMIVNKDQSLELEDKMKGLEKFYQGPEYDQEEGYPEIFKLIILVTEDHSN